MSKKLEDGGYRPPDKSMCEVQETPIDISYLTSLPGESRLFLVLHNSRGRLVHYAISQQWRPSKEDEWESIFRIDTSDGSVHCHRFTRDGGDEKELISSLPVDGRDILNKSYDSSYERVFNGVDARLRGWMK